MATRLIQLLAAALLALAAPGPSPARAASTLGCKDLRELISVYLRKHVAVQQLGSDARERVVENYLRRVDPQRSLLLEADKELLSRQLTRAVDEIRLGKCTTLSEFQKQILERHLQVEALVGAAVGEGFVIDPEASLVIDADNRGHPKTPEERNELLRTLAQFQASNYLAADLDLDEARKRVLHRYELARKRWSEKEPDDIYAAFLDSFAGALDPHSGYLSADDLEDFQIGMQLSLEGIGVALSERDGYAVVEQIIPGGAADRLDVLEPKDKIIAVASDGKEPVDVIDMALRDVVRLIRGKKGSRVQLTVLRQTDITERFEVGIVRDKINLEDQAAKLRFEELEVAGKKLKLGVLELPSFYGDRDPSKRQCSRDVKRHLATMAEEGADGLLLDLSRNGGGLLEDAVRITGFFIREGGVVAVKDAGTRPRELRDPDNDTLFTGPMVVLTSRVSASASEILAGALKDYRRAVIVGDDRTFGKGTVQSVIPLKPGLGAMRVTTALFFRPGGASTQNEGVPTDVVIPSFFNTETFGESNHPYSLPAQKIKPFAGRRANHPRGAKHWKPVTDDAIAELSERSRVRVTKNEALQRILQELKEREEDDGVTKLAEIQREREEARSRNGEEPEPERRDEGGDEEPTPQMEEALRILADLVLLQS